jgi:predicted DNA-binding protein (UPF0251 family)
MPRPKLIRKVSNPPLFKGFKPIGGVENTHVVVMNFEEYESIRLSDYELLGQMRASAQMGVSRSTFARIYESARRKVALSFTEGLPIIFEGGKVYFDSEWYQCNDCGSLFNNHDRETLVIECSLCGSKNIEQLSDESDETSESIELVQGNHHGKCRKHRERNFKCK